MIMGMVMIWENERNPSSFMDTIPYSATQ